MKPYDPKGCCPACGLRPSFIGYHKIETFFCMCPHEGSSEPHLHRKCERCGCQWPEATVSTVPGMEPTYR